MFIAPIVMAGVAAAALWTQYRANQASDALREEILDDIRLRRRVRDAQMHAMVSAPGSPYNLNNSSSDPTAVSRTSVSAAHAPRSVAPSEPAASSSAPSSSASSSSGSLSPAYESHLRILSRSLAAQPRLDAADRQVLAIIKDALQNDRISDGDRRFIERYQQGLGNVAASSSSVVAAVPPPPGYTRQSTSYAGNAAYISNPHGHSIGRVALDHIIELRIHRSANMTGEPAQTPYVHPSDDELYIVTDDGRHTDGLRKITVGKTGKVRSGNHIFR